MDKVELALAILVWGFIHSLLASRRVKDQVQKSVGEWIRTYYRMIYNIFATFTFGLIVLGSTFVKDKTLYFIPTPWLYLTAFIQLVSLLLLLVGLKQTGAAAFLGLSQLIGKEEPLTLKTDGLYAYVRHPLYTTGLILLWLIPVMTTNRLIISLSLTIYILIGAYFEEKKLLVEFGDEYRNYIQKVPMLLPLKGRNKIA